MKKYFMTAVAVASLSSFATAQIYSSVGNEISFFSEAPLENIVAVNKEGRSLINSENGEVGVVIPIKGFHFDKALMEEHFNENYMESGKFPMADFKGKINEQVNYKTDGTYPVTATGKLTIHGVTQERTLAGTLVVKGDQITLDTAFPVMLADHNVKIPTAVIKNIAETVEVKAKFDYKAK